MPDEAAAIERCAYCRGYVPVTHVDIPDRTTAAPLRVRVAVCENCLGGGR